MLEKLDQIQFELQCLSLGNREIDNTLVDCVLKLTDIVRQLIDAD
jgi:hypothetical protein